MNPLIGELKAGSPNGASKIGFECGPKAVERSRQFETAHAGRAWHVDVGMCL
ncbi:MAG: hypothetical protein JOY60_15320 [Burkholderiaceae bacterium]|nr:hypothetical protein [Burkholderiaceae bacterium]